jgi:hypothetical protein
VHFEEVASEMAQGLDLAERDFEARQEMIEALDLTATPEERDGVKWAEVSGLAGEGEFDIVSNSS